MHQLVFTRIKGHRYFSAKPLEATFLSLHKNTEMKALGSKHCFCKVHKHRNPILKYRVRSSLLRHNLVWNSQLEWHSSQHIGPSNLSCDRAIWLSAAGFSQLYLHVAAVQQQYTKHLGVCKVPYAKIYEHKYLSVILVQCRK